MKNMRRFALGVDFGTLSARAALVSLADGRTLASRSALYAHGVMDCAPRSLRPLPRGFHIQDPRDYLAALSQAVRELIGESGVPKEEIAAIGVDFTSCSPLPCLADGTPLCALPEFADEPNAYCKLWKHHAVPQAERITSVAREQKLAWLQNSGGRVSPEWLLPKLLEMKMQAPAAFARTALYLEAGDFIVFHLTGRLSRSENLAAYKNFYLDGYPDDRFFELVDPAFKGISATLLRGEVLPLCTCAGGLTKAMAQELGLPEGLPVCPALTDAHAGVPAAGLTHAGDMLSILGTSACHILQQTADIPATGIAGKARGGVVPGLTSYEANQGMGENFEWFVKTVCPALDGAQAQLGREAAALKAGESGLIALDWLNGNRCILSDSALSGAMIGLTLKTKPHEMYRALLESAAYAMRVIVENYQAQGLAVGRICLMGGIANKSPLLVQIIADVLNRPILISNAQEGAALGAAIYAAVACGEYENLEQASAAMAQPVREAAAPSGEQRAYERMFSQYKSLHDYFGQGGLMRALTRQTEEIQ